MIIVLEGSDNSGKTTQANKLINLLIGLGYSAKLLREPGGTVLGEQLRDIVLSHELSPETMALLFSASRRHMMETHVLPAVDRGDIVVLDRFWPSQFVYQEMNPIHNRILCKISSMDVDGDVKILLSPIGNYEERPSSQLVNGPSQDSISLRYAKFVSSDSGWHVVPSGTEDEVFEHIVGIVMEGLAMEGDRYE